MSGVPHAGLQARSAVVAATWFHDKSAHALMGNVEV